ncbi:MAG: inorganic diphosphatase [Gammaproteobacteria bacterium]
MQDNELETPFAKLQAHPWHGVDPRVGDDKLLVYIENTPLSSIKYEIDEKTGILKVDRSQETAALPPAAYGFVPRSLCGSKVAQLNSRLRGDRAALDICVFSERPLCVPGVLAEVHVIGGIPVKDDTFVDDKLLAVLNKDAVYGNMRDLDELPVYMLDRVCHFLGSESLSGSTEIGDPFGRERALTLLRAALDDYESKYGS